MFTLPPALNRCRKPLLLTVLGGVSGAVLLTSIASYSAAGSQSATTYLGSLDLFTLRRVTATKDGESPQQSAAQLAPVAPVIVPLTAPAKAPPAKAVTPKNVVAAYEPDTIPDTTVSVKQMALQMLEKQPPVQTISITNPRATQQPQFLEKTAPIPPAIPNPVVAVFPPSETLSDDGALDILNPSTSTVDAYLMAATPVTPSLAREQARTADTAIIKKVVVNNTVQVAAAKPSLLGTLGTVPDDIFQQQVPRQASPNITPRMLAPKTLPVPEVEAPPVMRPPVIAQPMRAEPILAEPAQKRSTPRMSPSVVMPNIMPGIAPTPVPIAASKQAPTAPPAVSFTPLTSLPSMQQQPRRQLEQASPILPAMTPPLPVDLAPLNSGSHSAPVQPLPPAPPVVVVPQQQLTAPPASSPAIPLLPLPLPQTAQPTVPAPAMPSTNQRPANTDDLPDALQELLQDAPTEEDPTLWQYRRPAPTRKSRDLIL